MSSNVRADDKVKSVKNGALGSKGVPNTTNDKVTDSGKRALSSVSGSIRGLSVSDFFSRGSRLDGTNNARVANFRSRVLSRTNLHRDESKSQATAQAGRLALGQRTNSISSQTRVLPRLRSKATIMKSTTTTQQTEKTKLVNRQGKINETKSPSNVSNSLISSNLHKNSEKIKPLPEKSETKKPKPERLLDAQKPSNPEMPDNPQNQPQVP